MDRKWKDFILIQVTAAFVINAVVNGLIAYFLNRGSDALTVDMGRQLFNLALDIVITGLILGVLNAWSAANTLKKQKAAAILPAGARTAWLTRLCRKPGWAGLLLGLCAAALLWGLTAGVILALGIDYLTLWGYVIFKTAYTGLLGGLFTGILLFAGMHAAGGGKTGEEAI